MQFHQNGMTGIQESQKERDVIRLIYRKSGSGKPNNCDELNKRFHKTEWQTITIMMWGGVKKFVKPATSHWTNLMRRFSTDYAACACVLRLAEECAGRAIKKLGESHQTFGQQLSATLQ